MVHIIYINACNYTAGAKPFPAGVYRFVDVRDVANAHIQAFEVPSASGRYILVGDVMHVYEALKIVQKHYPALRLPEK